MDHLVCLLWVYLYAFLRYNMANELHFPFEELAFVGRQLHIGLSDPVENQGEIVEVFFVGSSKYNHVIYEDTAYLEVQVSQTILHQALVSCR